MTAPFGGFCATACLLGLVLLPGLGRASGLRGVYVDALVPTEHEVIGEDQYVCFRVDLPKQNLNIIGIDPLSEQDVVHHMLLFGKHPARPTCFQMVHPCCLWIC